MDFPHCTDCVSFTRYLRSSVLAVLMVTCVLLSADAKVLDSNLPVHDPSRMVRDGHTWWIFATGNGIDVKYSPDKVHWFQGTPVFGPDNQDPFWAPDMWGRRIHGNFLLFYSQPTAPFGTKGSRIGVAVTRSLNKAKWTDVGTIIATSSDTDYNTIDPAPYYDEESDRLWLAFGSWFGGIYIIELDPAHPHADYRRAPAYRRRQRLRHRGLLHPTSGRLVLSLCQLGPLLPRRAQQLQDRRRPLPQHYWSVYR